MGEVANGLREKYDSISNSIKKEVIRHIINNMISNALSLIELNKVLTYNIVDGGDGENEVISMINSVKETAVITYLGEVQSTISLDELSIEYLLAILEQVEDEEYEEQMMME